MISAAAGERGRIIRVLTYGKKPEVVDQAILDAVEGGHRVLVKVAFASNALAAGASAVADWAGTLCRAHGLAWERVGDDVLFHRARSPIAPEAAPIPRDGNPTEDTPC